MITYKKLHIVLIVQAPKHCFLFQIKTKQILNNKHVWIMFKLSKFFNQLLVLVLQINKWNINKMNACFVWNKSNKAHEDAVHQLRLF